MCGVTRLVSPARRAACLMIPHAPTRDNGVPRAFRNNTPLPLPRSSDGRTSRAYNATAPNARRPMGTTRSFAPLPNTRTNPSS